MSNKFDDLYKWATDSLKANTEIPNVTRIELCSEKTSYGDAKSKIGKANAEAQEILNRGQSVIIDSYIKSENIRLEHQKPLMSTIRWCLLIQVIAFNAIIAYITIISMRCTDSQIISAMFDFLKYYIGAVLAEFIGLVWYITRITFNSDSSKVMETFLK